MEYRIQIDHIDAQGFQIINPIRDTLQIAAVDLVAPLSIASVCVFRISISI